LMEPLPERQADSLARLEERILQAAEAVARLRREKEAALQEAAAAKALASKLTEEVETLRAERAQVRGRIEKLLGQLELLNTA
jgi:FtsZ-binding cell division protein ZapB